MSKPDTGAAGETSTHNRVAFDRGSLSSRQEEVLERLVGARGKVLTPYKIWIHAPGVAEGMEALGTQLNTASSLPEAEREVAILATAAFWRSPYVIRAHERHGLRAGLAPEVVEALAAGCRAAPAEPRLRAVADFVADALAGASVADEDFARYEAALGRAAMAELLALIGYYTAVALAMRLHDVEALPGSA